VFDQLAQALKQKYNEPIGVPQQITQVDVNEAEHRSFVSGKPVNLATAFAGEKVAVMLVFSMSREQLPPVPSVYSPAAYAIANLLRAQYEQRKAQCEGTGDRRMDVVLIYMTRAEYDARVASAASDEAQAARQLSDQL
jgi:hypothetical protein